MSKTAMLRYKIAPICFLTLTAVCIMSTSSASADQGRFLYVQSNGILEGQNSIIAFERLSNGKLKPILGSPFLTGGTGMNNSTGFQMSLDPTDRFLYVICQRVNQTAENKNESGNILHCLKIDDNGMLEVMDSRHLGQDGVDFNSRPQGIVMVDQ